MYWNEDNRLMVLSDNGKTSRYTYNAAGERIVKSHGDLEGVYVNGAPQGMTFHETEDYTIYPAPIITVTKNRFTKHYFIGDKRIASKLGTGKFSNVYGISSNNVTAGQKDYAARMLQIEKQREEYYKSLGTPPGVPTMKGATADPDNTGYGYNTIIGELGDHSVPEGWVQRPKFNKKGDVPGPPIQWNKPEDPDNAQPGYGYVPADTTNTEEIFFYHSDHLGSTSYITDAKANITQFDAYLPYGELLVDEHSSSEEMPYKFNGKEFDQETGLYYYGARYMNPRTSLWYGVDPHIEEMAFSSSYTYCDDHPVNFVDIKGKKKFNWIVLNRDANSKNSIDVRYTSAYHRSNFDEEVVNIWAHGIRKSNPSMYRHRAWGLEVSKSNSGEHWCDVAYYVPRDVSVFSDRIDGADKGWRKRNNGHPILVLHCCASSTFAQEISASKNFKNVIIIAPDATLNSTKEKGEWINSIVYGKHFEHKRNGAWHVYMNGKPLKGKNGKEILYDYNAQPGTKGFDYKLNSKKQEKK
ncbi:RHS repeat domain-containing protein [Hoylesella shahii]|uniref:RHS repeat domain-containing protein n=1 Tax=Hoylesella shahii TaxID=228603 RepID=UPI0023A8AAB8|nr:RHS repeat-associated core domain-containing protein [Hoylesella shahii]